MSSEGQTKQSALLSGEDDGAARRACPRCGAEARRSDARFCSACGRSLDDTYLPADALRASYNLHRRRTASRSSSGGSKTHTESQKSSMSSSLYPVNRNGASVTAMAFVTYALVPYLGILFCPGALLMGGIGLYNSRRVPERGGRRASVLGITFGLLIFCAQLFLWWILYKIPQWANQV